MTHAFTSLHRSSATQTPLLAFTAVALCLCVSACTAPKTCGDADPFLTGSDSVSAAAPSNGTVFYDGGAGATEPGIVGSLPIDVEEADLVKLEGAELFVHNPEKGLFRVDVSDLQHPYVSGVSPSVLGQAGELYLRDQRAVVLIGEDECELSDEMGGWYIHQRHSLNSLDLSENDLLSGMGGATNQEASSEPEVFEVQAAQCLPGHLVASRVVDKTLYTVSSIGTGPTGQSWVMAFDLSDPSSPQLSARHLLDGATSEIHSGTEHLYLVQAASGTTAEAASKTKVLIFDYDGAQSSLKPRGDIVVSGSPQGRFHIDEYQNTLRLVTYFGRRDGSNVYVIDVSEPDTPVLMGELLNLAPMEDLHAARFVGDRLYVVTYESVIIRTDPLWVISLSDPTQPQIMGELIVPGFTSFLYPQGDQLLAVGRGDRGDRVAVSLFDISQDHAPGLLARLEVGSQESFSEANLDFRGVTLLQSQGHSLLALPLSQQEELPDGSCNHTNSLQLIEVGENDLKARPALSLASQVKRSFSSGDELITVGPRSVGTFSLPPFSAPRPLAGVWFGDANAPLECTAFEDIYGNSSDSIANDRQNGWGDDNWDWDEREGDWSSSFSDVDSDCD